METITFEDFALLMIGVIGVSMMIGGLIRWIILSIR
jgi:hypothetical protein